MKKTLIALSEEHFSEGAFDFAAALYLRAPLQLTAVFLPQPVINGTWYLTGTPPEAIPMMVIDEPDPMLHESVLNRFIERCRQNGIPFRIHEGTIDIDVTQLEKESRYADLLIAGGSGFFENPFSEAEWDNLSRMLHRLECPAVIVPDQYPFPATVVIAFDGSPEAVFALKQFYSTLPELTKLPTILAYAGSDEKRGFPDMSYITELAPQHFPNLSITRLDGKPTRAFRAFLQEQERPLLVCGAMHRGGLSRLFRKSFAYPVLQEERIPVFIAHP